MNSTQSSERHLNRQGVQQYLAAGVGAVIKIDGAPIAYLIIEPDSRKIALRIPMAKNSLPDLSFYQNLSTEVVHWEDQRWCQVSIVGSMILDACPLLYSIADCVQLQGADFACAFGKFGSRKIVL